MADKNWEEIPQVRGTKGRLRDSALSLVVIDVGHSESWPEEHLEQGYSMPLTNERMRFRINVLHRLGIRNHKVLLLGNQVTN